MPFRAGHLVTCLEGRHSPQLQHVQLITLGIGRLSTGVTLFVALCIMCSDEGNSFTSHTLREADQSHGSGVQGEQLSHHLTRTLVFNH